MTFDDLIRDGRDTDALRLMAREMYEGGKIGHTRSLLAARVANKCDELQADNATMRQEWAEAHEELGRLRAELATETELHHRFERLALDNAMGYGEVCDQLAESQRMERAAVDDIAVAHESGRCAVCKHKRSDGGQCKKWPDRTCFEWRGPQEAVEGEQDG